MPSYYLPAILFKDDRPVSLDEETRLALVHAYTLACEEHLTTKILKFISRKKPKQIKAMSRLFYKFCVVPLDAVSALLCDSSCPTPTKIELLDFDASNLDKVSGGLRVKLESIEDEKNLLRKLTEACLTIKRIRVREMQSLFLPGHLPAVKEILSNLTKLSFVRETVAAIISPLPESRDPMPAANEFRKFLESFPRRVRSLATLRAEVDQSADRASRKIREKYAYELPPTKLSIRWNGRKTSKALEPDGASRVIDDLVVKLYKEVEPDIASINSETRKEIERIHRTHRIDQQSLESQYDLEVRRLRTHFESELSQISIQISSLTSQFNDAKRRSDRAQNELDRQESAAEEMLARARELESTRYDDDSYSDSFDPIMSERYRDAARHSQELADRAKSELRQLREQLSDIKEHLGTLTSEEKNLRRQYERELDAYSDREKQASIELEDRANTDISVVEERGRVRIDEVTFHIKEIEREKSEVDTLLGFTLAERNVVIQLREHQLQVQSQVDERSIVSFKLEAIKHLREFEDELIDRFTKSLQSTMEHIRQRVISFRTQQPIDIFIPFWHFELEKYENGLTQREDYILSPSVLTYEPNYPEKRISRMGFAPVFPSLHAFLEAGASSDSMWRSSFEKDILQTVNPLDYLSEDHWIWSESIVKRSLWKAIKKGKAHENTQQFGNAVVCSKCKFQNEKSSRYCQNCGASL